MAFNLSQTIILKLHCDTTVTKKKAKQSKTKQTPKTAHLGTTSHLSLVKLQNFTSAMVVWCAHVFPLGKHRSVPMERNLTIPG